MPTIQLPEAELFYAAHLPAGARRTLLLIHGAGGSHLTWPAALRRLPETAVYTLDLAGHGRSSRPGRQTVADYAQDILDFMAALGLENVVVLGHSLGGAIAQQIGLAAPPAVVGLILLGTGARLRVSPQILAAAEADLATAVSLINQHLWGTQPDARLMHHNQQIMMECPPDVLLGDFIACNQFDLRDRLPEMTLPALVISSQQDQMMPPKFGEFLATHLPQAEFVLLPEAGHMMMLEAPQAVARLVQKFLQ
ncbi:MAG: alpha/beta hydrolase [Chloroflexota bacterium]